MKLATVLMLGSAAAVRVSQKSVAKEDPFEGKTDAEIFEMVDTNTDGMVSKAELQTMLSNAGVPNEDTADILKYFDMCVEGHIVHGGTVATGGLTWEQVDQCLNHASGSGSGSGGDSGEGSEGDNESNSLATTGAKDSDMESFIDMEAHYGNGDEKLSRSEFRIAMMDILGEYATPETMDMAMMAYDKCAYHHSGKVAEAGLSWEQVDVCVKAEDEAASAPSLGRILRK